MKQSKLYYNKIHENMHRFAKIQEQCALANVHILCLVTHIFFMSHCMQVFLGQYVDPICDG